MSRYCRSCGQAGVSSQKETYPYVESGLPSVTLLGVEVCRCPACRQHDLVLPNVTSLYQAILYAVVRKPGRLSAVEVRYLRRSLGWSGKEFALHFASTASTVSRWEKDACPIGPVADRLLRVAVLWKHELHDYSLTELVEITREVLSPVSIRLVMKQGRWERTEEE